MTFQIQGKVALVTGGATGIGLAYVEEFLKHGVKGVVIADVNPQKGEEAAENLQKRYGNGKVSFVKCDVTNVQDLELAYQTPINLWGVLDIAINNAGILNDKSWELQIAINCNAVVRGTLLAFKHMGKDQGGKGGVVVNIASILGLQELSGCPVYVGTKHFVVGLDRSFGSPLFFDKTGVKVLTMCPGVTDTPLISEAGHKPLPGFEEFGKVLDGQLGSLPAQPVECVAKGMMTLITEGENGSVWVCEGKEPIYQVGIPDRKTLRKN